MLRGDEAYSGSRSYYALQQAVQEIFGYPLTIPLIGGAAPSRFTSPCHQEWEQEKAGSQEDGGPPTTSSTPPRATPRSTLLRGEERLHQGGVRYLGHRRLQGQLRSGEAGRRPSWRRPRQRPTSSAPSPATPPGQPVSIANLKAVYEIARKYDIPSSWTPPASPRTPFIQQREPGYANWTIEEITRESYKYADGLAMSAKKDAMVQMGGLLCFKDDSMLDVYTECRTLCVVQEGFPTHGGLEGAPWSAWRWACGTACARDWLAHRIGQVQYLVDGLEAIGGVPAGGGHVAFVDAGKLLPHIPADQFPAHALACELQGRRHPRGGDRFPAAGRDPATGKQHPCPAELLRLTIPVPPIPRPTWTLSSRAFGEVKKNAHRVKGLDFIYERPVLPLHRQTERGRA